jgi:peptidoglycan/LPS O-acetylase OafA/YrhL
MSKALTYRPEIDGLRALAVLPVVAYHLGFRPVSGGYIGVDIFFVISGFLIGRIILKEAYQRDFSILRFYRRRIRRLFPALFFMFLSIFIAAYFILYPKLYLDLAYSMIAAATSLSNIYFFETTNYFDSAVDTSPLLHTWSLAVEEQFYIFFPPIVLLIISFAQKYTKQILVLLLLASLILASFIVETDQSAAFYLPHLRAWELLVGVMLAANIRPVLHGQVSRTIFVSLGLLGITLPVFTYSHETTFPGLSALVPCFGTAMIIIANENGKHPFSTLLSFRPIVFIGLISYSLYLWHWPVIILYQQYTGEVIIKWPDKILLFTLSILIAFLSWKYIETPFRANKNIFKATIRSGLASISITILIAVLIVGMNGFPDRFSPQILHYSSYIGKSQSEQLGGKTDPCFLSATDSEDFKSFDINRCLSLSKTKKNLLILGDSHARHLVWGLNQHFKDYNFLQATGSGCMPILRQTQKGEKECRKLVDYTFDHFLSTYNPDIDLVIVAARWQGEDLDDISKTMKLFKSTGNKVIFIGPIVQYNAALPQLLALSERLKDPELPYKHILPNIKTLDNKLEDMAHNNNIPYASAFKTLCQKNRCRYVIGDAIPIQYDYGHLTLEGSDYLISKLFKTTNPLPILGNILNTSR